MLGRLGSFVMLVMPALLLPFCGGCDGPGPAHPAIGRAVGNLPLVSLADPARRPPTFMGKVTLLNFWGTWCMPCRREMPGLVRLAERLRSEPAFQLVAVSCGSGRGDDPDELARVTNAFLMDQRLALDAWADPDGRTRLIFSSSLGFNAFPTSYLVGADGQIRNVWVGYRPSDEADMARAVVAALKAAKPLKAGEPLKYAEPLNPAEPPSAVAPTAR